MSLSLAGPCLIYTQSVFQAKGRRKCEKSLENLRFTILVNDQIHYSQFTAMSRIQTGGHLKSESQAKGERLTKVAASLGTWLGRAVTKFTDTRRRYPAGRIGHRYVPGMETATKDYSERLAKVPARRVSGTIVAAHLDLHHTDCKLVLEP